MNIESENINLRLKEEIDGICLAVDRYNATLNTKAIWLLLSTLACWSVTNTYFRITALVLVLILFGFEINDDRKKFKKSLEKIKTIKNNIHKFTLSDDEKKARLYDLEKLKKDINSIKTFYLKLPRFVLCYSFWATTLIFFLIQQK